MKHIGLKDYKHVHFIGIGGVSMSGLAEILARDGFHVSGSDRTETNTTRHLRDVGIDVIIGAAAANITTDVDLVVYTAAIKEDNPERMEAARLGIPTMVRAELLGLILQGYEYAVCIAGTHGKTSTTALVTAITTAAGLDPTVNIGGYIGDANYFVGDSPYFILEACEYSNSFHHWHPQIGVILNIDADHMDFHGNMDALIESFAKFASNIRPGGTLIMHAKVPGDSLDIVINSLSPDVKYVLFHTNEPPEVAKRVFAKYKRASLVWPRDIRQEENGALSFDAMAGTYFQARINLPQPGEYNMYNALAAFAVGQELQIEPHVIATALSQAKGVKRRYEHKGEYKGTTIIDDYAHHPTEIKACLAAARKTNPERIICLFQPHTYTRTRNHFEDFSHAFGEADITLFAPIYAAREPFDPSISSAMLAQAVADTGKTAINCNSLEEAEEILRGKLMPGDLLITMGAGDVYFVGEKLLAQ